jgi:hypothetical protein
MHSMYMVLFQQNTKFVKTILFIITPSNHNLIGKITVHLSRPPLFSRIWAVGAMSGMGGGGGGEPGRGLSEYRGQETAAGGTMRRQWC